MQRRIGLLLGAVIGVIGMSPIRDRRPRSRCSPPARSSRWWWRWCRSSRRRPATRWWWTTARSASSPSASTAARPSTCWCCRRRASRTTSRRARSSPAATPISPRSASASWSRTARPSPTSRSVEAFKQALLKAKSVGYIDPASGGSSGIYVAGLLDKLGIADEIKPKAKLQEGRPRLRPGRERRGRDRHPPDQRDRRPRRA